MIKSTYTKYNKWVITIYTMIMIAVTGSFIYGMTGLGHSNVFRIPLTIIGGLPIALLSAQFMTLLYPLTIIVKDHKVMTRSLFRRRYYSLTVEEIKLMKNRNKGEYRIYIEDRLMAVRISIVSHTNFNEILEAFKLHM